MDRDLILPLKLIMHELLVKEISLGFFKCEFSGAKITLKQSSQISLQIEFLCQLSKFSVLFF